MARFFLHIAVACLFASFSYGAFAQQEDNADGVSDVTLQVYANGKRVFGEADLQDMNFADETAAAAKFKENIIPIKPDESVQLRVELIESDGSIIDITRNAATQYQALAPWKLAVSATGLVTMSGTPHPRTGDTSILVTYDAPEKSGWNKVFFQTTH